MVDSRAPPCGPRGEPRGPTLKIQWGGTHTCRSLLSLLVPPRLQQRAPPSACTRRRPPRWRGWAAATCTTARGGSRPSRPTTPSCRCGCGGPAASWWASRASPEAPPPRCRSRSGPEIARKNVVKLKEGRKCAELGGSQNLRHRRSQGEAVKTSI